MRMWGVDKIQPVWATLVALMCCGAVFGQSHIITGHVMDEFSEPLPEVQVALSPPYHVTVTDSQGIFEFSGVASGIYILTLNYLGKGQIKDTLDLNQDLALRYTLKDASYLLKGVEVHAANEGQFGMTRLNAVDGAAIYAAKKNEVVVVDQLNANLAANVSRQVYAKVPGLNIWESDGAGVQLGIGGRGLSPNRSSNFNTRQNGYDISADALGYPESYYTPPVEALERIEIVRGAASLQYGTQFGGMLNFRFKQGPRDKSFSLQSRQSMASYGFFSSYNHIGGTIGKVNYSALYQYKHSDGWRPNSSLDQHTAFASLEYRVTSRLTIRPEFTLMRYLAQQPGGLTDAQFEMDPSQSNRSRNWFEVSWNTAALIADYQITDRTKINTRFFGLASSRQALGNLDNINLADFGDERDLISDTFRNWGNETRLLHRYGPADLPSTFLVGFRYYNGFTHRRQGNGNDGSGPDFDFLNPDNLEGSDFNLPSNNVSFFAETVFNINPKLSVTPGFRFEYIRTEADGYYRNTVRDLADNVLLDERVFEHKVNERSFAFFGLGLGYKLNGDIELYGNISQNYRAINFNDIRVNVGSLVVDENLMDERGFNADLGLRGAIGQLFNFDISLFHLSYNDRIGTILKTEPNPNFNNLVNRVVRFRTNIADAKIYGLESYGEVSLWRLFGGQTNIDLTAFANIAVISSEYVDSEEKSIEGNRVELVPKLNAKAGTRFIFSNFRMCVQFTFVSEQFSDATNARRTANAVEGIIPAYHVADLSIGYVWKYLTLDLGINNFTNQSYFTRRASGYPGPGIIPAEPRSAYITVGINL